MRSLALYLVACTFSGCATEYFARTQYVFEDETGGYSEPQAIEQTRYVRFSGNANTPRDLASLFSRFRAEEVCAQEGFKFARILSSRDNSRNEMGSKAASYIYTMPVAYSGSLSHGQVPGQSGNGGVFGGSQLLDGTYAFPTIETSFRCANTARLLQADLTYVSGEQLKEYSKDLLGAMQVTDVPPTSINKDALQVGDIILRVNRKRVVDLSQFLTATDSAPDQRKITMQIVRDGKRINITVATSNATSKFEELRFNIISDACAQNDLALNPLCAKAGSDRNNPDLAVLPAPPK